MILNTVLGKLFRLREESHQKRLPKGADDGFDPAEKPFLDHLEDLRKMIMKMAITLTIAMIACFGFRNQLFEAMRLPMIWAEVGNPDAWSLQKLINPNKYKDLEGQSRFEPDEVVFLESGLVGVWKGEDREAEVSQVEFAPGVVFQVRTASIAGSYGIRETKEAKEEKAAEKKPAKDQDAETPVTEETQTPVTEETQTPVTEETQTPVTEETQTPVTEETQTPVTEETQTPVTEETQTPVTEETQTLVTEEAKTPAAEEAQTPVAEETQTPVTEDPKASAEAEKSALPLESLPKEEKGPRKGSKEELRKTFNYDQLLIMETFTPYEALVLSLKLAFFAGVVLSVPFLLWFLAEFIVPGLKQQEKKVIFPALAVGFVLFLIGAAFAFRLGLPMALRFLAEFTIDAGIKPGWRIGYYIKFVTQVILVFGLCFELPVAVLAMVKMDLLTYRTMRDSRSYAIVILMIISAIFTPPDPMTLILLSGPLILLYEMCIWLAYFMEKRQLKAEAEEERARAARLNELTTVPPSEMTEEEKREQAADDIARYEASLEENPDPDITHEDPRYDEDGHDIDGHEDPYHAQHDPYHQEEDWDHDHHGHEEGLAGGGIIDINHATAEELQQLPGIGPTLAQRIIEGRPFYSEEELEYHAYLPESVIRLIIDRIYFG